MVTTFASVTDKFNETDSSKIYSYLNGIIFCIPALAPIVGYHITQHLGWHSNFFFMAMVAVPACVITMFYFSETKEKTDDAVYLPGLNTYKQVLIKPSFLFHAIAVMLAMATIMAFVSTAPNVFVYDFSASEQTFTFWFSLNATVTIVVSFIAAKLFSHFSLEKVIATGMMIVVTSGVLLLSFTNKGNLLSYILPVLLGTVGLALLLGAAIGKALALFNENVGLATAVLGFIQMSGAAFVVTLLQALNLAPINQVVLFSLSFVPLLLMYFIQRYRLQAKSVNSPQL